MVTLSKGCHLQRTHKLLLIPLTVCSYPGPGHLMCQPTDAVMTGAPGGRGLAGILLGQETLLQRLHKVEVLDTALGTGHCLTVV